MSARPPAAERISLPMASRPARRALRTRVLLLGIAPVATYAVIRPFIDADALGLAIAGAIPVIYNLVLVLWRRRVDLIAVLASIGLAAGCIGSLIWDGSPLPLKLHEALVAFAVGLVLLVAVLIRRPLPLGHLLGVRAPSRQLDSSLGVLIGGFLVLHALLHVVLATTLPTPSYLGVSRLVSWGTVAVGALCLSAYLRRARAHR